MTRPPSPPTSRTVFEALREANETLIRVDESDPACVPLYAAAPELYEALRHAVAVLNAKGGPTAAERDEAIATGRTALAKAVSHD